MRAQFRMLAIVVVGVTFLAFTRLGAQEGGVCTPLVEQALSAVSSNCGNLSPNSVCYGFNRVDATFNQAMPDGFFRAPADRARLIDLQSIRTVPLSLDTSEWGVAVMNVQANLPGTLPGQAVTFVLIGDGTLENAVPPGEAATVPNAPVSVSVATNANIRSAPSPAANVLGWATPGTTYLADGVSRDLGWLRVAHGSAPAWLSRSVLGETANLETLPIIDETRRSPMQAFYFRSGAGSPTCVGEPPATLLIQGPQNVAVNLSINGVDFVLGSTIALVPTGPQQLSVYVLEGMIDLADGTWASQYQAIDFQLDSKQAIDQTGSVRLMTEDELKALSYVEMLSTGLLHYTLNVPTEAEILAMYQPR